MTMKVFRAPCECSECASVPCFMSPCCKNAYKLAMLSKQILSNFSFPGDCGPPIAPQNGTVESYTSTMESSEVFYSCDPGLLPEGRMRTVCTENRWSPNPADMNCTVGMW